MSSYINTFYNFFSTNSYNNCNSNTTNISNNSNDLNIPNIPDTFNTKIKTHQYAIQHKSNVHPDRNGNCPFYNCDCINDNFTCLSNELK